MESLRYAYFDHNDVMISAGVTSFSITLPEVMGFGEKWIFAVFTALTTACISALVRHAMDHFRHNNKP